MKVLSIIYFAIIHLCIFISLSSAQTNLVEIIDKFGNKIQIQKNIKSGSPHRIFGNFQDSISKNINKEYFKKNQIKEITQKLLDDYPEVINIKYAQLKEKIIESHGGLKFVNYLQTYNKIPIQGSEFGYSIDSTGNIVSLGADLYYDLINLATNPKISKNEVEKIVSENIISLNWKISREIEPIIFPKIDNEITFHLCWKIGIKSFEPFRDDDYLIDSNTGEIIDIQNKTVASNISGIVIGGYWPQHHYDTPVTSVPFITNDIKLLSSSMNLEAQANTDAYGNYSMTNIPTGAKTLVFPLLDSYCQIINGSESLSPAVIEVRKVAVYNNNHVFSKNWDVNDASNVKWHMRFAHDYYKNTFNYNGVDYIMRGHINSASDVNGLADGENLFFGTQGGYYWARTSDVIYHEYSHNVHYKLYGGEWIGSSGEAGAMREGLADYFACSINHDPNYGESVSPSSQRNLVNSLVYNPNLSIYVNAQVIGAICWEIRQAVGVNVADNLVFRALQLSPKARNFQDFLQNMLVADANYYNSSYQVEILHAFSIHSVYPTALTASIAGPTYLNYEQNGTWNAIVSGGIPPYSFRWYYYYPCDVSLVNNSQSLMIPPCGIWNPTAVYTSSITRHDQLSFKLKCVATDAMGTSVTSNLLYVFVYAPYALEKSPLNESNNSHFEYKLYSNYPNPFNPSTIIKYSIKKDCLVRLKVFDALGKQVSLIVDEFQSSGEYTVNFDASSLTSGIYYYELFTGDFYQVHKMLFTK